jgi:sugar phosphate isomerase/epimerase
VKDLFGRTGRRPGAWGLPVDWRGDEQKWKEDLGWLRQYASLAGEIGALRTITVVIPFSNDLPFDENYAFHVRRLKPAVETLQEYGCRLGLEFIGPKTLRNDKKYEFIYSMGEMLGLCGDLGPNAGLLLDLWHWYTSHGTMEDLRRLTNRQVVAVHVNDAPPGIPVDEQLDLVRCLPGETGVLDIAGFLKALHAIGYDGPVTPEPFSKRVNEMAPEDALRTTAESMQKVWAAAGV